MKSGWVTKKLGEVCEIIYGYPFDSKLFNNNQKGLPIIRIRDVVRGFSETFTTEPCDGKYWISKDDVLIGMDGDFNISTWKSSTALLNQRVCKLESGEKTTNLYLRYILPTKLQDIWDKKLFTTVKHLSAKDLNGISIPIPPLAEQKRIVAKIDAAFEKIDKLKANAEKNLANAKKLFQSALDEAMHPKDGWVEKRLGEVGPVCMCKRILKSQTNTEDGVPFYKIGTFGKEPNAYISQDIYERYRKLYKFPQKGDILISAAGTIGRTVVYDGKPAYFQDSNIVWIANCEQQVLNSYLKWFYATAPWNVTKGTTIPRLYNENIESAVISFPPLSEQREIVKRLDLLAEKIKLLEQNYTRQIADCVEMRQAVLREAFEGRL